MSKCKHCGAEIIWITTLSGKNMPCEAEAVAFREKVGAKDRFVTPNGEVLCFEFIDDPCEGTEMGYIPHFANCT